MKTNIFILLLSLPLGVFAQGKVKLKKDVVTLNGEKVFTFNKINMHLFSVNALDGTQLLVAHRFYLPTGTNLYGSSNRNSSSSNNSTNNSYFDLTFINTEMLKCEIPNKGKKALIKELLYFNLIKGNALNEKEVLKFTRVYDTKYSNLKQGSQTVIINH